MNTDNTITKPTRVEKTNNNSNKIYRNKKNGLNAYASEETTVPIIEYYVKLHGFVNSRSVIYFKLLWTLRRFKARDIA